MGPCATVANAILIVHCVDRPDAHNFCVVYDEGCISSEDSETNRKFVSLQLQEIVKVAISKVSKHDDKMHYTFIKVSMQFPPFISSFGY